MKFIMTAAQLSALFTVLLSSPAAVSGLAARRTAQENKAACFGAFSSPSGKLTISPEIYISSQNDNPTALLLQATALNGMSVKLRKQANANAIFVDGAISALRTICSEQEEARGQFPGPLPVVYCASSDDTDDDEDMEHLLERAADAGATGMVVSCENIASADDLASSDLSASCEMVLGAGLQPVPEIIIEESTAESWSESDVTIVVEKVADILGEDPVSVMLTVNVALTDADESTAGEKAADDEADADEEAEPAPGTALPQIPKALSKRIPIVGSIRVKPAENAFVNELARLKDAGFTSAIVRKECVPGYGAKVDANGLPVIQNLEYVGSFMASSIAQLKSVRSKSFGFRAKNEMEKQVATQWANLQEDVIDSGALGDMSDSFTPDLDESKGEYRGFAN